MISKILRFAKGFGSVLGKLFLPVTIVMLDPETGASSSRTR